MDNSEIASRLKKGAVFSTGYNTCRVIDSFRLYVFGEVSANNRKYYDILTAREELGNIRLDESRGSVGLRFDFDGSTGTPLSLERMQEKWTALIVKIGQDEARKREQEAQARKREAEEEARRQQAVLATEFKTKAVEKLRSLAASMTFKKFISSRDAKGLLLEAGLADFYNTKKL